MLLVKSVPQVDCRLSDFNDFDVIVLNDVNVLSESDYTRLMISL